MQRNFWPRVLRFVFVGWAVLGVSVALGESTEHSEVSAELSSESLWTEEVGICAVGTEFGEETTCPLVSCLTQQGYNECMSCSGCMCDPMTDWCTPTPPPPPPKTGCPNVSCLSQAGYEECVACPGCDCHPRTDQCYAPPSVGKVETTEQR